MLILNSFTWAQIETIANNHYAEYMFNIGDYKKTSFRSLSDMSSFATILDFNVNKCVDGSYANIYFGFPYWDSGSTTTSYTFKHSPGTIWENSTIRTKCLEAGDQYYTKASVSSSTSGTYYIFEGNSFVSKTLPNEYESGKNYYKANLVSATGEFISSLTTQLGSIKPKIVLIKQPAYYNATNEFIYSKDRLFLLSGFEICGGINDPQLLASGIGSACTVTKQLEFFKDWRYSIMLKSKCSTHNSWLRDCDGRTSGYFFRYYMATLSPGADTSSQSGSSALGVILGFNL